MTDRLSEIQELQAKRSRAQTALTQAQTRKEGLLEQKEEIISKMAELGVTPENVEEKLTKLVEKRDLLMAEAKEKLDKLDI